MEKSKKKFKLSGVAIFNIIVGIITVGLLVYFIVSDGGIIDLFKSKEGVIWWALIRTGKIWDYEPNSEIAGQTFATMRQKNPNILLWPILQSSINKNSKLHQIEGWS